MIRSPKTLLSGFFLRVRMASDDQDKNLECNSPRFSKVSDKVLF